MCACVYVCHILFREQEVKELLQNNLLKKYQKIIDQAEEQEISDRTQALVELSLLVIFCVEVITTLAISY